MKSPTETLYMTAMVDQLNIPSLCSMDMLILTRRIHQLVTLSRLAQPTRRRACQLCRGRRIGRELHERALLKQLPCMGSNSSQASGIWCRTSTSTALGIAWELFGDGRKDLGICVCWILSAYMRTSEPLRLTEADLTPPRRNLSVSWLVLLEVLAAEMPLRREATAGQTRP